MVPAAITRAEMQATGAGIVRGLGGVIVTANRGRAGGRPGTGAGSGGAGARDTYEISGWTKPFASTGRIRVRMAGARGRAPVTTAQMVRIPV